MEMENISNIVAAWTGAVTGVISLLWNVFKRFKPDIISITAKTGSSPSSLQIAFNYNGPLIGLNLKLYSEKKYNLVKSIDLTLLHVDTSAKYTFKCINISFEGNNDFFPIELQPLYKNFFWFQESEFPKKTNRNFKKIMDKANILAQTNKDYLSVLDEPMFQEYINLVKENFLWKTGKYEISFSLNSSETFTLFNSTYKFELFSNTLHHIEKNIDNIKSEFEFVFRKSLSNDHSESKANDVITLTPELTENY